MPDDKRYPFDALEAKWQAFWQAQKTFEVKEEPARPKRYLLDMFPYPSGDGLHLGHGQSFIPTDVMARYWRSLGFNVLHPMGFDAFGLPAEQYAIAHGRHPMESTQAHMARYRQQLVAIGLGYDWSRSFSTTDPGYYRWTQWIFLQLFDSWYDQKSGQAKPISRLREHLGARGTAGLQAAHHASPPSLTAAQWQALKEEQQESFLAHYRLAYRSMQEVNWCPELGTVLANEEVKEGRSERGGHPVVRKKMAQWSLRITAYADRLLEGLEKIDWAEHIKEIQRNWIGRSSGVAICFSIPSLDEHLSVFTTRAETLFGVTYLAIAPEHPLVGELMKTSLKEKATSAQEAMHAFLKRMQGRSERSRMQQEEIDGVFSGAYAQHPFTKKLLPIWLADYVLPQYGTGAIMAVPGHDQRDHAFACRYNLPIVSVIAGKKVTQEAYEGLEGRLERSEFIQGYTLEKGREKIVAIVEEQGLGQAKTCYRLRDAIFSRQRYWGEPFPIYYKGALPYALPAEQLPLKLPPLVDMKPSKEGVAPLARSSSWKTSQGEPLETHTMPGWAGSSWYFIRYMDPRCSTGLARHKALDYWGAVDLYIGGAEHATGHLLYARFFAKFLYDRGYYPVEEPFTKLLNQGLIQGKSCFVYRVKGTHTFVSYGLKGKYETTRHHVDIRLVNNGYLDTEAFRAWRPDLSEAQFILEGGRYCCGYEVEKMSKSKYNTITPDEVIAQYGADTLRLYILFLGPVTQAKPWDTKGILGVHRFLGKVWDFCHGPKGAWKVKETPPSLDARKALHKGIKQIRTCLDRCAFNTAISALMILLNAWRGTPPSAVLIRDFARLLAPFAPHLAEELWAKLGHEGTVLDGGFPTHDPAYLEEETTTYPVAINGRTRLRMTVPKGTAKAQLEQQVSTLPGLERYLAGKKIGRVIVVPGRMINLVLQ